MLLPDLVAIDQPWTDKIKQWVDDKKVAEGHIPKTQPFVFSADEGADVGMDGETAVSDDYKQGDNKFTGKIAKVTIDLSPSKLSDADEKKVEEAGEAAAAIED
jgi:arylsulfatase